MILDKYLKLKPLGRYVLKLNCLQYGNPPYMQFKSIRSPVKEFLLASKWITIPESLPCLEWDSPTDVPHMLLLQSAELHCCPHRICTGAP